MSHNDPLQPPCKSHSSERKKSRIATPPRLQLGLGLFVRLLPSFTPFKTARKVKAVPLMKTATHILPETDQKRLN